MLSRRARQAKKVKAPPLSNHSAHVMEVAEASAQLSKIPSVVVDRLRATLVENELLNDQVSQLRKQVKNLQGRLGI